MTKSIAQGLSFVLIALGLTLPAAAQDADYCVLYEDLVGDVGYSFTQDQLGTDQFPMVDIESFGVGDDGENFEFYIKVVDLSTVSPQTSWSMIFTGPDGNEYTARMETDTQGNASYIYYQSASVTADPETWVASRLSPNTTSGEFTAEGLIKIVVPATGIGGTGSGDTIGSLVVRVAVPQNPTLSPTPDNAPNDLEGVGVYSLGGSCPKTTTAFAARVAAENFPPKACSAVTDAEGDTVFANHDVVSVSLTASPETMLVTWNFSDATMVSADAAFGLHWKAPGSDQGRFIAFVHALPGNGTTYAGARAAQGSWDQAAQTYTVESTYLDADGWVKDVSGNSFSLVVPLADLGYPSVLMDVGSLVINETTGAVFESTADDGFFSVNGSSCGQGNNADGFKSADAARAPEAAAGAAGALLLLIPALAGLRRRRRR